MISHHDKCLFVHVPKCAGQSIEIFFLKRVGLDWERRAPLLLRPNETAELGPPRLAHLKAHEYVDHKWMTPAQFDEYFKFAFVRNPWDRLVSFYRFMGYDRRCSFSRFVERHLSREFEKKPWFMCPQVEYIYDADGKSLVDFVGRFEDLAGDFAIVCERMGIPDSRLPHINHSKKSSSGWKRWFRRPHLPYRDMYDARCRQLVGKFYEADVDTFKYQF